MDIPASRCLGLPRHTAFKPPTRKKLRISSLTIKDGSVVLRQKVLVREEIEVVHQGAGHEERQHALERGEKKGKKAFFKLPKSTPQENNSSLEVSALICRSGTVAQPLTFFSRHTMLV